MHPCRRVDLEGELYLHVSLAWPHFVCSSQGRTSILLNQCTKQMYSKVGGFHQRSILCAVGGHVRLSACLWFSSEGCLVQD